ncbi:MAG TPA: hypothetical protein VMR99_01120, partial [Candidatus Paceibacterota bacterium]|nr:hypothetical protein [Candidatus Paceibacterota bacterium]
KYFLRATAHDALGAESLATAPQAFTVLAPSVISFGFVELGWFDILIIVILLVITGTSLALWRNSVKKQRRGLYGIVAARDIEKLSDLLSANIKDLSDIPSIKNAADTPDIGYLIGIMNENVAKMKKYLKEELKKLK